MLAVNSVFAHIEFIKSRTNEYKREKRGRYVQSGPEHSQKMPRVIMRKMCR